MKLARIIHANIAAMMLPRLLLLIAVLASHSLATPHYGGAQGDNSRVAYQQPGSCSGGRPSCDDSLCRTTTVTPAAVTSNSTTTVYLTGSFSDPGPTTTTVYSVTTLLPTPPVFTVTTTVTSTTTTVVHGAGTSSEHRPIPCSAKSTERADVQPGTKQRPRPPRSNHGGRRNRLPVYVRACLEHLPP